MSRIFKSSYVVPLPTDATITDNKVTWINKHHKRTTGVLTADGKRVRISSPNWNACYRDETGKRHIVSTNTPHRELALKLLNQFENDIIRIKAGIVTRDELIAADNKTIPIDELLTRFTKHLKAKKVSTRFIDMITMQLNSLFTSQSVRTIDQFTHETIESWLSEQTNKSNCTLNHYLTAFTQFTNWCIRSNIITKSPTKHIKRFNPEIDRKHPRRAFTTSELDALFNHAHNANQKLLYYVLVTTGIRIEELLKIQVKQFDLTRNNVTIIASQTKNRKSDVLPLRVDTARAIKEHIIQNKLKPDDNLFGTYYKNLYHRTYIRFKNDLIRAGISRINSLNKKVDLHSFRKTFGTMLARAGVPLTTTQRLMRHADPKLTAQLYIDVDQIDLEQAVEKIIL